MKIRSYIYLAIGLTLLTNPIFALHAQQQLKDVLVGIIKTQYTCQEESADSRAENKVVMDNSHNAKLGISQQQKAERINVKSEKALPFTPKETLNFSDFNFTITHNQAVVRFALNHQMKSAFFEKKGEEWKLVTIADLPEMLF